MTDTVLDLREMAQSHLPVRSGVIDNFLRLLGETAGARFIAANRVLRRDLRLTELTVACSVYLIILTLLPYLLTLPSEVVGYLDFFRIILSFIILITAILHYSGNNYAKSDQLHRSGFELSELKREIEMRRDAVDLDDLDILRLRYENILQKFNVDHDRIDSIQYQIENRDQYPLMSGLSAFLSGTDISLRQSLPRIILISVSLVTLFIVLSLFGSYPTRLPA